MSARATAMAGIREAIGRKGVSKAWLARRAGVKRAAMSNYLHGVSRWPREVWDGACRALGLDPDTTLELAGDAELIIQQLRPKAGGKPGKGKRGKAA